MSDPTKISEERTLRAALPSGGWVEMRVQTNWFEISDADRAFINDLLGMFRSVAERSGEAVTND